MILDDATLLVVRDALDLHLVGASVVEVLEGVDDALAVVRTDSKRHVVDVVVVVDDGEGRLCEVDVVLVVDHQPDEVLVRRYAARQGHHVKLEDLLPFCSGAALRVRATAVDHAVPAQFTSS